MKNMDDKAFFNEMTISQAKCANPIVLAYVGDAVHSLFVREKLAKQTDYKANTLHVLASKQVNAHAQSLLAEQLFDSLTEEEKDVFRRGHNGKSHHVAKNQTLHDYKNATAIEAVFGYLYLTGQTARLAQLLTQTVEENEN